MRKQLVMLRPLWAILLAFFFAVGQSESTICQSHDKSCFQEECNITATCKKDGFCFTLWRNTSKGIHIAKKGCWFKSTVMCKSSQCLGTPYETVKTDTYFFCCCSGDYCNANISLAPKDKWVIRTPRPIPNSSPSTVPSNRLPTEDKKQANYDKIKTLLYSIIPIFGLAVLLALCLFMYHHQKQARFIRGLTEEEPLNIHLPPSPVLSMRPIQRLEVVSQSQGGITVWKAKNCLETVAVKIFPEHEKGAWINERDCYALCNISHENVLKFIAVEKHVEGIYTEYWLITEFHEYGSLADYLKRNILSWSGLCQLVRTIACGLAYVHSEVKVDGFYKPCIAHRDMKTKNILVKSDLSCCIADFGLALTFDEKENPGEMHGLVGTKRYMAPEVLEGAIIFTKESFLRIDMYALGLVLWEIASRCSVVDGPVEDYRLPFEEEVGLHPSLEDMQQVVVQQRIRPQIRQDWRNHKGMASLVQTIEDCWDQDGEARLTSQCVEQRIFQFAGSKCNPIDQVPSVTVNNTTNNPTESSI